MQVEDEDNFVIVPFDESEEDYGIFVVPDLEELEQEQVDDSLFYEDIVTSDEDIVTSDEDNITSDEELDEQDESTLGTDEFESALEELSETSVIEPSRTTSNESQKSVLSTKVIPKGRSYGGKRRRGKASPSDKKSSKKLKHRDATEKKRSAKFSSDDSDFVSTPKKKTKKDVTPVASSDSQAQSDSSDSSVAVKDRKAKSSRRSHKKPDSDSNVRGKGKKKGKSGKDHIDDSDSSVSAKGKTKRKTKASTRSSKSVNVDSDSDPASAATASRKEEVGEEKLYWLPKDDQDYVEAMQFPLDENITRANYKDIYKEIARDHADEYNIKIAHIINPVVNNVVVTKDADFRDMKGVVRMDGYKWRDKGNQARNDPRFKLHYWYSETETAQVTTKLLTKRVLYDSKRRVIVQQYIGDLKWATPDPFTLRNVPVDEWPKQGLAPNPKHTVGAEKLKEKYEKYYEKVDSSQKLVGSIAKGKLRSPPAKDDDSDNNQNAFSVKSQELEDLRKRCKKIKAKRKADPLNTSEEDDSDVDDPNKTAEQELFRAIPGYVTENHVQIGLDELYNLKQVANDVDAQWKDEGRRPFWEDSSKCLIVDPQPNEFYFRDFSKVPHKVEQHEAIDGYGWKRGWPGFVDGTFCTVHKQNYTYKNQETGRPDHSWSKTVYIFPKDGKAIIHYKGIWPISFMSEFFTIIFIRQKRQSK